MRYLMKELRKKSGMTQKEFAEHYEIPISTLRKWEQGEASPAPYVLKLIAGTLPGNNMEMLKLEGRNGLLYYYDQRAGMVYDQIGNGIKVEKDLTDVKAQNLIIYLEELYEAFYEAQNKFNRDCQYDKEEDVIWTKWEE